MSLINKTYQYPPARQADVVDDYHGTAVADPYRWLEETESAETQTWVAAENELTRSFLDELPGRAMLHARLKEVWDYERNSVFIKRGKRYFFAKNDGLQNQAVLYQQDGLDNEPSIVIDPNAFSEDGTVALVTRSYSKDGRYLAYGLSKHGSDWQEMTIRDVENNVDLAETIQWVKFSVPSWLPDNSGFFYARYPAPGEMPDAPPSTHQRVYFHKLGTSQANDKMIYARPEQPDWGFHPEVSEDGQYLILYVWQGTDRRRRIYYRPLDSDGDFVPLLDDFDALYDFLGNDGSLFYFRTDLDALNGRVITIDIQNPAQAFWRELIPEGSDVIDFAALINQQFVIATLHHAHHQLNIYNTDGSFDRQVQLPALGAIWGLAGKPAATEMFINFQSFLYPPTILRYDFVTDDLSHFRKPKVAFDPTSYVTEQKFSVSQDGTQVPLFITRKKDLPLNGGNPTLLYGYGGFTVNMTPAFSPSRLTWLERGGIIVQAGLRGGNEYGEAWHKAGMLDKKQNVFDDFIGAAEWLIKNGYTRSQKLAIQGGSNGGLLVAVCMLQRPSLFGAVHCAVPVADMLRFHKFTAGRYWTSEYGNAEDNAGDFKYMLAYSPLHNVQPGETYPPILITTADTDDRVVPMHSKKFTATLQAADSGKNPILLRIETKAGHGLGKPTSKMIAEATDVYSFLWAMLTISESPK